MHKSVTSEQMSRTRKVLIWLGISEENRLVPGRCPMRSGPADTTGTD